jgi:histidine ammonia-lyase
VRAAHRAGRQRVPTLSGDRVLHRDIAAVAEMISAGVLLEAVCAVTGPLA